jgi:hypothetical protein
MLRPEETRKAIEIIDNSSSSFDDIISAMSKLETNYCNAPVCYGIQNP